MAERRLATRLGVTEGRILYPGIEKRIRRLWRLLLVWYACCQYAKRLLELLLTLVSRRCAKDYHCHVLTDEENDLMVNNSAKETGQDR